jgi:hypothetical protein
MTASSPSAAKTTGIGSRPAGWLKLDETIEDGLVREILEETGLTVTPDRLTGVYKNLARGIVALVFRCSIVGGTAAGTEEAAEIAWLSPEQIAERMDEAYAVSMLDALQSGPSAIRAHNRVTSLPLTTAAADRFSQPRHPKSARLRKRIRIPFTGCLDRTIPIIRRRPARPKSSSRWSWISSIRRTRLTSVVEVGAGPRPSYVMVWTRSASMAPTCQWTP